ncbi:acyltransferase family protein [Robbsia andropogonis]|uniref:acyltransferase family protein n=1 Tax=Robbsia andropogonis TaxID=28092 RepID=UPI001F22E65D|nr:acyltransferase [Robbsia andropogonis]
MRALAAVVVVAFHASGNVAVYSWHSLIFPAVSRFGEIGVDIFFVISGFVIMLVSHDDVPGWRSARDFAVARITRVVPLYWILTAAFVALLLLVPAAFGNASFSASATVASFLFFPTLNWTGIVAPVLNVGWTLNYEMWFYLLFAAVILTTRHRLVGIALALAITLLAGLLPFDGIALHFYTNPIVLEFLAGCCLGALCRNGRCVPPWLPVVAIAATVALATLGPDMTGRNRLIAYGVPAFAIVASGLAVEHLLRWPRAALVVGDSSYSLYLTHVFTVPVVLKVLQRVDGARHIPGDLVCLTAVLASVFVGIWCYRLVERPVSRLARAVLISPHWSSD